MAIVIKKLVWDNWNIAHIVRHNVIPKEVEEVCRGIYISYKSHGGRFEVIEVTQRGRILLVVVDPEPAEGEYYVVTSYTANKKDKDLYRQTKGGEKTT